MNYDNRLTTSDHRPDNGQDSGAPWPASNDDERRLGIHLQQQKKGEFIDEIIRSIDMLIYCELSILYCLDCSFLRFLVRGIPQWVYFTPKPSIFPPPPASRPYIGVVFGTNILCLILHVLASKPQANEALRGYLHGGFLIDFVGQKPTSKATLVGLDLLILGLQLLTLSATTERKSMKSDDAAIEQVGPTDAQDHDLEERGQRRRDLIVMEAIELRTFRSADEDVLGRSGEASARDAANDAALVAEDTKDHPLDVYNTGEHVIVTLHVLDTVKQQWNSAITEAPAPSSTVSTAVLAATEAGRRLGYRLRITGRDVGPS